jgi:hypothetical protein
VSKAHLLQAERARLIAELQKQQLKLAGEAANELRHLLYQIISRTFKHWNESGENTFDAPQLKTAARIKQDSNGSVTIYLEATVVERDGSAHRLWHWLSFGTEDRIQRKRSPVIRERKNVRTFVGNLDASPFPGFTGRKFVIHAGKLVRGMKGRRWYEAAVVELEKQLAARKGKLGQLNKWGVSKETIENPL